MRDPHHLWCLPLLYLLTAAGTSVAGSEQSALAPIPRPDLQWELTAPMPRPAPTSASPMGEKEPGAHAVARPDLAVVVPVVDGKPASVCDEDGIIGLTLPKIEESSACGILEPVKIHSAAGITLAPPPVISCRAGRALSVWLEEAAKPAFAEDGSPLEGLDIAAAYVCRNVNRAEGGAVSQHARGRAIDISQFRRRDGTSVSVLEGWHDEDDGPLLRKINQAACGIFSTTLGPDSDVYHADHFHYDVAERRRPYCP
jgi:hypothetical protein